jgi:hypothetical protein
MDEERKAGKPTKGTRTSGRPKLGGSPKNHKERTLADQGIDKNLADRARKAVPMGKEQFAKLNGHDPVYIVSSNLERRSLTAGQKAIGTALLYPETKRGRPETHSARRKEMREARASTSEPSNDAGPMTRREGRRYRPIELRPVTQLKDLGIPQRSDVNNTLPVAE